MASATGGKLLRTGDARVETTGPARSSWCFAALLILNIALALIWRPGAASADDLVATVADWSVFTWVEDDGSVDSCYISADYHNGITLFVIYGREDGFGIMLTSPDWALEEDSSYPVAIEIDRFGAWDAELYVVSTDTVHFFVNDEFITEFTRGYTMRIEGRNQNLDFSLSGTARAIAAVRDCERRYASAPSSNPFGGTSGGASGSAANPFGDGSGGANARSSSRDDDAPMTNDEAHGIMEAVVEEIMEDRRFRSVRYLDTQEYENVLEEFDIRWSDGDVVGGATVSNVATEKQTVSLLSSDAGYCDGKFGSVRDDIQIHDTLSVTQLGLVCQGGDSWGVNYLIIPADDFSIVIAHVSGDIARVQELDDSFLAAFKDFVRSLDET